MKLFLKILVLSLLFFSSSVFASSQIVKYKMYNGKNQFVGFATVIYDEKGSITDYEGVRFTQVTENGQTIITIGDIQTYIKTNDKYWHTLGVGVMRSSIITTSEGERGLLHQTLLGTNKGARHYDEKVYLGRKLVSEAETFVDEKDQIIISIIKNGKDVVKMVRQ